MDGFRRGKSRKIRFMALLPMGKNEFPFSLAIDRTSHFRPSRLLSAGKRRNIEFQADLDLCMPKHECITTNRECRVRKICSLCPHQSRGLTCISSSVFTIDCSIFFCLFNLWRIVLSNQWKIRGGWCRLHGGLIDGCQFGCRLNSSDTQLSDQRTAAVSSE